MTHPDELQLTGYVDGSLPEDERSAVAGHLTSCEECRVDVELAVQGRAALASLPVAEAPPIELPSADDARPATHASPSGMPRWYRALAGVAAAAAIVALVAVIVPNLGSSSGDRTAALDSGGQAEAGSETPAPQASGGGKSVVDSPTDYDAAGLDSLARDQAASPDSSGGAGVETTGAADEATVTCLTSSAEQGETLGSTIIVARFEGTPAWIGVYSHRSGTDTVDRVVVRALAQQGCRLLATAEAAA